MTRFNEFYKEGFKELIKWLLGIISALIVLSFKNSFDQQKEAQKKVEDKVDKVYQFAVDHEVRLAVIKKEIEEHEKKIKDLEYYRDRVDYWENKSKDWKVE